MALCNVTGTVYLLNGELAQSRVVIFERDTKRIRAEYLGTTIPQPVITKTDKQGQIDVNLVTGVYQIKAVGPYGGYIGNCVVPDDASARLEDIIDVADLPEAPPVWLSQVTDARDQAVDAADRADDAADQVVGMVDDIDYAVATAEEAMQAAGVTPQRFGAVGDGLTNDTAAFQAMANYARANRVPMVVPGGTYLLDDTINLWHPCSLVTDENAVLIFSNMGGMGEKDGFVINLDPDIPSAMMNKYRTSRVSGFTVFIVGQDGGDFIRTPQGEPLQGTNILNGHAPMYVFENMQLNGAQSPITSHVSQFNWKNCFNIGPSNAATVRNCVANGGYNTASEPTPESTASCFIRLSASRYNDDPVFGALRSPFITNNVVMNFGRVIDFGRSVSRTQISHFYVHNCWEGFIGDLVTGSGTGDAGEVSIANCNINVQRCAISFSGVNNGIQLVDVDCTRAPGQFDHAEDWEGVRVSGPYRLTMTNCGIRQEHVYTNTSYGVRVTGAQSFIASGVFFKGVGADSALTYGIHVTNPIMVSLNSVHHMLRCANLVWLGGNRVAATDITLSSVGVTSSSYIPLVNRLVMEGQIGRWCVRDLDEVPTVFGSTLSFADGDNHILDITPQSFETRYRIVVSNGSVVRLNLLSGARPGDVVEIQFNLASTGGSLGVFDSTGTILASAVKASGGGTQRYYIRGNYLPASTPNAPSSTYRVLYSGESNTQIGDPFPT